jgi:hypothetical protein
MTWPGYFDATHYPDETTGDYLEAWSEARREADAEQAELEAAGVAIARARARGVCTHGSVVGYRNPPFYPEQEGLQPGQLRCTDGCGAVFDSDEAWSLAMDEAIRTGVRIT